MIVWGYTTLIVSLSTIFINTAVLLFLTHPVSMIRIYIRGLALGNHLLSLLNKPLLVQYFTALHLTVTLSRLSLPYHCNTWLYVAYTLLRCAFPKQYDTQLCHHYTSHCFAYAMLFSSNLRYAIATQCFTLPTLYLTEPYSAVTSLSHAGRCQYTTTPCKTFTMLNYASPFRHFAILHSSLAMQVNSLLFSTEQYPCCASTSPHFSMPLLNYALQCHSDTTLSLCHSGRFRTSTLLDFFPSK